MEAVVDAGALALVDTGALAFVAAGARLAEAGSEDGSCAAAWLALAADGS